MKASNNSNTITIQATGALTNNYTIILPNEDTVGGNCLTTNRSGLYNWTSPWTFLFGPGILGDATFTGTTLWPSANRSVHANDLYYDNLTFSGCTGPISFSANSTTNAPRRILVRNRLLFNNCNSPVGVIQTNGFTGTNGAAVTTQGAVGLAYAALTLPGAGAGTAGAAGITGAAAVSTTLTYPASALGNGGGGGGNGGLGPGGAGTTTANQTPSGGLTRYFQFDPSIYFQRSGTIISSSSGGRGGASGGGGGVGLSQGPGGGGGGAGGGSCVVYAKIIEFTGTNTGVIFSSAGGDGGNGGVPTTQNRGGAGGGGGGGGGYVQVICNTVIGVPPTTWIKVSGGRGGSGSAGHGTGGTGFGGQGGSAGSAMFARLDTGSFYVFTGIGSTGATASGSTGGLGATGYITQYL